MDASENESLRQALIEVEHLRQLESEAKQNTAALLEGLKMLSLAGTAEEGLGSVLAVLANAIDYTAGLIVSERPDGRVRTLATTIEGMALTDRVAVGPLRRALDGSIVNLADASRVKFAKGLAATGFPEFRSAILAPAGVTEFPAVIICLHRDKTAFGERDGELLRQFRPLASQAIRHVMKLEELADAVRSLESARDQALTADKAKSEFIASMSHEMRTPMNGILGLAELLSLSELNQSQRHQLETLRLSGKVLFDLIETVLDVSSLELRAARIESSPFDPVITARHVVDSLMFPADEKGLALKLNVAPDIPRKAVGDEKRIAQVMRNLIANAIKYTSDGWIEMNVSRSQDAALYVEVVDTGRGVSDAYKEAIFEKFVRGSDARINAPGLGLGLSICKELIELMEGRIGVTTAPTGGACFWFLLPNMFPASEISAPHARAS